ncbi:hypothetical protein GCM10022198_19660 [Klugiella xanthotipulae]|uniref:YbaB/EbfC DNA-binding family protein n=1 Tax=Klugiella xanthotipulae TaxID=244735 RepID=A0A543I6U4_9MICO|nr:YbaB/EbfC family nucleoid-associated protein [Klugiella xanthotipulae]TQM66298.1 YbaB/EbfC DNA-binding family protein [Klugiella xanthotipulae]
MSESAPQSHTDDALRAVWERAERVREASEKLREIVGTAESPDGGIRITVGGNGIITELSLSPVVDGYSPEELREAILSTLQRARGEWQQRSEPILGLVKPSEEEQAQADAAKARLESFLALSVPRSPLGGNV